MLSNAFKYLQTIFECLSTSPNTYTHWCNAKFMHRCVHVSMHYVEYTPQSIQCQLHPLKDTVSVGIDVQISKYWCVDTEVLTYWYTHMWMHVFTNLRAHIANPLCQIRPPKDMSSIHSKCIDGFISCYIYMWIHFSEELQTLSKTLTRIPCIDERSLAYSAFQFRLAATGPEKRLALFQCINSVLRHKEG